jgi:hypothetical protein
MISGWNRRTHRYGTRVLPRPSRVGHHKHSPGRERSEQTLPRILPDQHSITACLE